MVRFNVYVCMQACVCVFFYICWSGKDRREKEREGKGAQTERERDGGREGGMYHFVSQIAVCFVFFKHEFIYYISKSIIG